MALLRSLGSRHIQSYHQVCRDMLAKAPLGRPGYRHNNPFLSISLRAHSICSLYLIRLGMLNEENIRVGPDGIGPRHVANGVKGIRKGSLQCHYVTDHGGETRAVTLVCCTLGADLRETVALGGEKCTRAVWGNDLEGAFEELLHLVPLICILSPKLTFREVVFLMPLRPWGGDVLLHDWAGSIRGSWKLTCFAVSLKLQGVEDKGTLRSSIWKFATRFGT